jgi:hypothetical protein
MKSATKRIDHDNDFEYGSAINGHEVGSGFDVHIKRESPSTALLSVIELMSKTEYLGPIDVQDDDNLQQLAVDIGCCPGDWISDLPSNDPDDETEGWDEYAERWNAIKVK